MAKNKGRNFETWFSKRLSLWWTEGDRDDVFWHTAGSGGRGTNRARYGQKTSGSHGDITALDPIGKPFLDLFTLELKRGYSKQHLTDVVDKGRAPITQWEGFFSQAIRSAKLAETEYWMIVNQRDRREAMLLLPHFAAVNLQSFGADLLMSHYISFHTFVRDKKKGSNWILNAFGLPVEQFWDEVKPLHIKLLLGALKAGKSIGTRTCLHEKNFGVKSRK